MIALCSLAVAILALVANIVIARHTRRIPEEPQEPYPDTTRCSNCDGPNGSMFALCEECR